MEASADTLLQLGETFIVIFESACPTWLITHTMSN